MKKRLQKLSVAALLAVCMCAFGAWTPAQAQEIRYGDFDTIATYATETISYTSKDDSVQNTTDGKAPQYGTVDNLKDACGPVAGAIAIGYYDKYAPDLIAGWTSHFATGKYRKQDATYVPAVIHELYTAMHTNVGGIGVTESDFLSGMRQYASKRNYTATFTKVGSSKSLDFAACKAAIDDNKIIVLFADAGNVKKIVSSTNYDQIENVTIAEAHIMIVYGYMQIKYYNANGLFRTDTYLHTILTTNNKDIYFYNIASKNLLSAYKIDIA